MGNARRSAALPTIEFQCSLPSLPIVARNGCLGRITAPSVVSLVLFFKEISSLARSSVVPCSRRSRCGLAIFAMLAAIVRGFESLTVPLTTARRGLEFRPGRRNGASAERRNGRAFGYAANRRVLCGWLTKVRIEQRLSLQKHTGQAKQSVCDTTESTPVRVAALA